MQASAPCRIVEMTAEVLGLEYEFKVVDLQAGDNMKPEYLALNPQHNIPCVKDGDFVGNESRAVAAYLASKYGKDESLYPKSPCPSSQDRDRRKTESRDLERSTPKTQSRWQLSR